MALNLDELKFAVEDARIRHEADVGLIYFNNSQAMTLIGFYITLAIALVSAAAAAFAILQFKPFAVAFITGAVFMVVGSVFCFRAMRPEMISLPGRNADFWLWALHQKISFEDACKEYLKNLEQKNELNSGVNERSANALEWAKIIGMMAPIVVGAVAVISPLLNAF